MMIKFPKMKALCLTIEKILQEKNSVILVKFLDFMMLRLQGVTESIVEFLDTL